jgi:hypothetical protein
MASNKLFFEIFLGDCFFGDNLLEAISILVRKISVNEANPLASKNARQKYICSLVERFGRFFILGLIRVLNETRVANPAKIFQWLFIEVSTEIF